MLKHVRYLSEFGWNPIVLTVENGDYSARDESLLELIPPGVKVVRTHIYEPYDLYRKLTGRVKGTAIDVNVLKKTQVGVSWKERLAELIRATIFIPDARIGWLFTAVKEGLKIIEEYDVEMIYSSSPPYTCSLIGKSLHGKTGVKWVAGFRDPWTGFLTTPKRWWLPRMIDRAMEKSVFLSADAVEAAWQGIIDDAEEKYPELNRAKFFHNPNGFDSSDFPSVSYERNSRFTLTYTGSLYSRRTPSSLFLAIEKLISSGELNATDFTLRFVGRFGDEIHAMMDSASFTASIERIGYVPHNESIRFLMTSDAVLLIVDEAKESSAIVPGKVYEYLGVGRPIIAIAPVKSAIANLMEETNAGDVVHQSDIDRTARIFLEYFTAWKFSTEIKVPNSSEIKKYERRESARALGKLMDDLVKS